MPTPYWQIKAKLQINDQILTAEFAKEAIETRKEVYALSTDCKGRGQIEVTVKRFQQRAPVPFDLGTLQVEAYRLFGYDPKKTLDTAQGLYLDALISYPRTSSQKLPPTIGFESILKSLGSTIEYRGLTAHLLAKTVLKPCEGSREDPAHPAIYPTGKLPGHFLNKSERRV